MSYYGNSGYIGQSMSLRAHEAYLNDEKPFSKWSKSEILDSLDTDKSTLERLNKYSVQTLRQYFLKCSSWHHTGKYYTCTDFYSIDEYAIENINFEHLDSMEKVNKEDRAEAKAKVQEAFKKGYIIYEENTSKFRKHPHFEEFNEYCLLKGDWAYTVYGKKSLKGSHILQIKYFDKAPKGTAKKFKYLLKKWK